jgi:hypothetical protein
MPSEVLWPSTSNTHEVRNKGVGALPTLACTIIGQA